MSSIISRPRSRRLAARLALSCAVALVAALTLSGAALAGVITGTVTSGGTAVSGAFVTLQGTGGKGAALTDGTGAFSITIADGSYTAKVSKQGFALSSSTLTVPSSGNAISLTASGATFTALPVHGGQIGTVVNGAQAGIFYATTSVVPQVFRTVDYGGTWVPVTLDVDDASGLDGSTNLFRAAQFAVSGVPGEVALKIGQSVYFSVDFGNTWTALSGFVPSSTGSDSGSTDDLTLHWGHANTPSAPSVLIARNGSFTRCANMSAGTPTFGSNMVSPYANGTDVQTVVDTTDGSYVVVLDTNSGDAHGGNNGDLLYYALDSSCTLGSPVTTLTGFLSNGTALAAGGLTSAGSIPAAVVGYSSTGDSIAIATKEAADASFDTLSIGTRTPGGGCGLAGQQRVAISVAPTSGGVSGGTAAASLGQCLFTKTDTPGPRTASVGESSVSGINNNAGFTFDAGFDNSSNRVIISGDGQRGLIKAARFSGGVPQFPSNQNATAGIGSTSGGIAVNGFTVPVVKDTVYGPSGETQIAVAFSPSGGGLGVASDDSGASMQTVVSKGGYATDWWTGSTGTWLTFGHSDAGSNLLTAVSNWTNATMGLNAPNVTGTTPGGLGLASPGDVTAIEGVEGTDTLFLALSDGTTKKVVYGAISSAPAWTLTTTVTTGIATPKALAYCGATSTYAGLQDVLFIATGDDPATGALLRVDDATGTPSVSTIGSVPNSKPVTDVRVDCDDGKVYASSGTSSGGPSGALYKSTDGGATFSAVTVSTGGPAFTGNVTAIGLFPDDSSIVEIAGNSEGFVYLTRDGGTTWTTVNDPNTSGGRTFASEGILDIEFAVGSVAPSVMRIASARRSSVSVAVAASVKALFGTGGGLFRARVTTNATSGSSGGSGSSGSSGSTGSSSSTTTTTTTTTSTGGTTTTTGPIRGTTGDETLTGTTGNDVIISGGGRDTVNAGAGNDIIIVASGTVTVNGGDGDDTIIVTGGAAVVNSGTGNDLIVNQGGTSLRVNSGAGADRIVAGKGKDVIDGGAGNDTIKGGAGDDTIKGGDGNDTIYGGAGRDDLDGGAGNDTIYSGDGFRDTVDGGTGNDTATVDPRPGNGQRINDRVQRVETVKAG